MRLGVALLLAAAALTGCGSAHSGQGGEGVAKVHTAADVRHVFGERGVRLQYLGFSTDPVTFTATTPSSARLRAQPPYASQSLPLIVWVEVYPSVEALRFRQIYSTVGNAGPTHEYTIRNVIIRLDGFGSSRRIDAAIRALR